MENDSLPIVDYADRTLGATGVLRRFDTGGQTAPLSEIRQYLAARYDARFHIDPRRFEDVVVSVYRDLGYDVEATGKTGDGGVDAVLRRNGSAVGVQVKRVHGRVEAEAIRSFAGALYLKGMLRGVFVTTSDLLVARGRPPSLQATVFRFIWWTLEPFTISSAWRSAAAAPTE